MALEPLPLARFPPFVIVYGMQLPHTQAPQFKFSQKKQNMTSPHFSSLIRPYEGGKVDIGLLGVPSDTGVIQGGGRAGAALGPDAIREALSRYGTRYNIERDIDLSSLKIADFGNLVCDAGSVEQTHQCLTEAVSELIRLGVLPILFGGGHDLTFGGVRGLAKARPCPIGGITLDAHFDVREVIDRKITSGTPFRNILDHIEEVLGSKFVEIGINGLINDKKHLVYLEKKEACIFSLSETRQKGMATVLEKGLQVASDETEKIFCSIDLDAVAQAFAPGTSAPSPEGLTPEEVSMAAYHFGLHKKTAYFDIMELNPNFDQDGRTARLAAALVLHFVTGFAQRENKRENPIGFRML